MDIGREIGLVSDETYDIFDKKKKDIEELTNKLKEIRITPKEDVNNYLKEIGSSPIYDGISLYDLLKRPEIEFEHIHRYLDNIYDEDVVEQVVIGIKYEGYITKANKEANKMLEYENIKLSSELDYSNVPNLAKEAVQKLNEIKPVSVGQAIRISGVNPADITMLMLYLKRNKHE
jgi:tRNA uridine 5-carboxymethylaminomethyl modification enzyme